jgi:transcriptional regulator with XRE-family HTH domain
MAEEQGHKAVAGRSSYRDWVIKRLTGFAEFVRLLESDDLFDRKLFLQFRSATMSQAEWAQLTGVSQGTVGNWERGITYPGRGYRRALLGAATSVLEAQQERLEKLGQQFGIKVSVDVVGTQEKLNSSILRAALTDFTFDEQSGRIVPVPFETDTNISSVSEIVQDKKNLLDALAEQTKMIISGVSRGANMETDRFVEYLSKYGEECSKGEPNPRLLHRFGATIAGRTSDDDFRAAISGWDDQAIDGFNSDHIELMRLYFREALARAQEVEASNFDDGADDSESADNFYRAAELLSSATRADGKPVFSSDIPTLLRDIGREVRDFGEAEAFTYDDRRKAVLRRRRKEAIKSGSIYLGRILFFTSLFVVMSPESLGAAGSVASIIGLMDAVAPGTVRGIYERARAAFPILPKLEVRAKKK